MAFYFTLLTMRILRITFIIILTFSLFSDIGWCDLQEHPVVQNIKKVLDGKVVSERCAKVLRIFVERLDDVEDEDVWAIKMLDATSKVPVGPLSYSYGDLGHFKECLEIESKRDNVTGKYCLGQIGINASVAELYSKQDYNKDVKEVVSIINRDIKMLTVITWSICLPSSCTMEDIILLTNKQQPFGFGVTKVSCQTIEDVYPVLSRDALIGIFILSLLALIVLISTTYDIYCHNDKIAHPSFVVFSLYTNSKKLFHHSKRVSSLSCLDGIRVISMLWVMIYHMWALSLSGTVFDTKNSVNISNSIMGMVIINGDFACDTFLLVGGTLVTYIYFKRNNGQSLTFSIIVRHYIHRIIRLTPVLAGVVLISGNLMRYMGSGPRWPDIISDFEEPCKKNWWLNLLYIQNQFGVVCVKHSWYMDVDMQLYIFSPLIFWILSKCSKAGITLLILATFSSILIGFIRESKDNMRFDYTNDYYFKTETRAAPWIMGTILGYCLTRKGFTEIYIPKKIAVPIWILSFAIILISTFSSFGTLTGLFSEKIKNPFYITLVRPSFALAVGWIIWACATNQGGVINNILSLSIFQFLNKFTYSMYLIHPIILFLMLYSSPTSAYLSILNLTHWFWGLLMFSFGISIISILFLEMPIITIEKLILSPSVLDATSKVPEGPLSYRFGDLGHFQECINIESKRENVTGKYCLGEIGINASVAELYSKQDYNKDVKEVVSIISHDIKIVRFITWAICLPSSCTVEDNTLLINKQQPVGFDVTKVRCQTIEDVYPVLSRDALIGISILSLLALIVLISTSYDIYCQKHKIAHPGLVAFSLYTNSKKLFHHSKRVSSLSCLDGIRVISMLWVIMYHMMTISILGSVFDTKNFVNISNSIMGMVMISGHFACDTFLLVGGTLVTYNYFKKNNGQSLTFSIILQHYVHRIIRLTPVLAGVVLISGTLLRYMGSGPKWPDIISYFEEPCKKNWWLNLLYIQNQFEVVCVGYSWYLDVDMQLYIFSPLIFWMLSKCSKAGITLLILATFSSILIGFIRASKDNMRFDYTNDYYFKTETRAAPWIIGTILGYCLTRKGFTQICVPKKIAVPIWILSFAIILMNNFSSFGTLTGIFSEKFQNPFYIALGKPSFALAVGWIIWACATNHGGIIHNLLSLSIFQFLNKFIYSIYLIHPIILHLMVYSSQTSAYLSVLNLTYWFWGILMFAFGISIISILVLEMPIIAIEKLILSPSTKKEEITANNI